MISNDLELLINEAQKLESELESAEDIWYLLICVGLAASSCGDQVAHVYEHTIAGRNASDRLLIHRRLKEGILKTAFLYGIPRALQALTPLYQALEDEDVDPRNPRFESLSDSKADVTRKERGRKFFETLWGAAGAQSNNEYCLKHHKDLFVLNKLNMEWMLSENSILNEVETEMITIVALVCSQSPTQASWHSKGVIRFGGCIQQAKMAQEAGQKVAQYCRIPTERLVSVDELDI